MLKSVKEEAATVQTKPSKRTGIDLSLAAITEPTIADNSLPPKHERMFIVLMNFLPCNLSALSITDILFDNGKIIDITALSSGELTRVNTATLVAIRKLMSSISKSRINVLFLDEVINVLDEQGREKLVEVLLQEEGLNTYIVSHGWTHPLLEKIEVIKEDNISRLE